MSNAPQSAMGRADNVKHPVDTKEGEYGVFIIYTCCHGRSAIKKVRRQRRTEILHFDRVEDPQEHLTAELARCKCIVFCLGWVSIHKREA
jgi:hypothetical protein